MKSIYPQYKADYIHNRFMIVRCKGCGAPLKNKTSRRRGYGASCWKKYTTRKIHMKDLVEWAEYGSHSIQGRLVIRGED